MARKRKVLDTITALDIAMSYLEIAKERMTIREAKQLKILQDNLDALTIAITNRLFKH